MQLEASNKLKVKHARRCRVVLRGKGNGAFEWGTQSDHPVLQQVQSEQRCFLWNDNVADQGYPSDRVSCPFVRAVNGPVSWLGPVSVVGVMSKLCSTTCSLTACTLSDQQQDSKAPRLANPRPLFVLAACAHQISCSPLQLPYNKGEPSTYSGAPVYGLCRACSFLPAQPSQQAYNLLT